MDIRKYFKKCNLICSNCKCTLRLCRQVKYLYSKDNALTFKHNIYIERRNTIKNSKDSYEPDLILELFVADNINKSPQDILTLYNYNTDVIYKDNMVQKINRIKRKIKSMYKDSSKDYVENYLNSTDMKSFKKDELDIYIDAIKYLYLKLTFTMSYLKNPHKKHFFKGNWFDLYNFLNNNPNTYRGNELFFLGSFCKGDKKKRNLCNRLIIDLGDKKAFSYEDIDYILDGLKALSYSKTMFFKHLKFIKNFNIKK